MKHYTTNLMQVESHKYAYNDVLISKSVYKELNDKFEDILPIRSQKHRNTPSKEELGVNTYIAHEAWGLFKKMGLRVLVLKNKGYSSYIVTENFVTRKQFQKVGYKEVKYV